MSVGAQNHIALLEPGLGCRAVRGHRGNECALRLIRVEPEALGDRRSDALDRDAEPAARHVPVLSQLRDDVLCGARRYREADPHRTARRRIDCGIDADDAGAQIEGRPARIATVDRRANLDENVVRPFIEVAPERRNDAGRHRAAEPERVAHRHHPIPDLGLSLSPQLTYGSWVATSILRRARSVFSSRPISLAAWRLLSWRITVIFPELP